MIGWRNLSQPHQGCGSESTVKLSKAPSIVLVWLQAAKLGPRATGERVPKTRKPSSTEAVTEEPTGEPGNRVPKTRKPSSTEIEEPTGELGNRVP
jgi:hypothetical protein